MSKKVQKNTSKPIKKESAPKVVTQPASGIEINWYFVGLGVILLVVLLIRMRLLGIPLERDEGEYAYMGNLILNGIPPYKDAYNMKLPGTYYMYALWMGMFGTTITGVHFGLLIMTIGTILLLFFSFRTLFTSNVALIASGVYGLMSLSANLLGFAAHATHFMTFYIALALFFYSKFTKNRKWFWALLTGIALGMSFLMKQQAVFMLVFGFLMIVIYQVFEKPLPIKSLIINAGLYSIGVFIPYLLVLVIMSSTGVFDTFWFWTVQYASKYAGSGVSMDDAKMLFGMSFEPMYKEFMGIWWLCGAGLIITYFSKYDLRYKLLATGLFIFTFLTVCPGFYFRQHYFIPFLISVGLMAGITLDAIAGGLADRLKINGLRVFGFVVLAIIAASAITGFKDYYLKTKPEQLCKRIYGTNPFVESVEISKYLKENTTKEDKIAVLGSEPQIFFYADRSSATGYIYTYGLMESHDYNKTMQKQMIDEIEKNKPKYLVYCNVRTSWLPRPDSPMDIFTWFNKYSTENYEVVGIVDGLNSYQPQYKWNELAKTSQPQGEEYILVFKRKV
ncbi:MAG: glycosyltransferase family 39 protein [Bacteroidota bacterium]|nr:glycosyltransferase family 39 protein [Bacteroidota bacterium]